MDSKSSEIEYCLYARKSSESDERQAMSIDSQIKEMQTVDKPINFELNGKSYHVEVRCKGYSYDVLKIGEYEIDVSFSNKRLQIQISIQGYPKRSTIVLFQLEVHSESVGSFPMLRDNQTTIHGAREFLGSLSQSF